MPIYEYRCKCGREREVYLPLPLNNTKQICECGEVMLRKISLPSAVIIIPTGKDMALDSLNSKHGGLPGGTDLKDKATAAAVAGIDRIRPVEEKVFTGFDSGKKLKS